MISKEIEIIDKSGDCGRYLDGFAMRIYRLESSVIEKIYRENVEKGMDSEDALKKAKKYVDSF